MPLPEISRRISNRPMSMAVHLKRLTVWQNFFLLFSKWTHSNLVVCFQNLQWFPACLWERLRNSAQSILSEGSSVCSSGRVRTPARCERKWKRSSLSQVLESFSPSRRALSHATRLEKISFSPFNAWREKEKKKKKEGKNCIHFLRHRIILQLWLHCLGPSVRDCWVFGACVETRAGPAFLNHACDPLKGPTADLVCSRQHWKHEIRPNKTENTRESGPQWVWLALDLPPTDPIGAFFLLLSPLPWLCMAWSYMGTVWCKLFPRAFLLPTAHAE